MLLGLRKTIYDHIIEALLGKSMSVLEIIDFLRLKNTSFTIQGIYKALRELIADDIVVKEKKNYIINNIWRNKISNLITNRMPFKLSDGEQVTFKFRKIEHTDMFWKHIFGDIQQEFTEFPVFHALSHNFWYLVPTREISEKEYYDNFEKTKTYVYSLIGGDSIFDKKLSNETDKFQFYNFTKQYPFNRRDHVSVIGSYVITTRVSLKLINEVDSLYLSAKNDNELRNDFTNILLNSGITTIIIENNIDRAKKIRKKVAKDFYISKELIQKFGLY